MSHNKNYSKYSEKKEEKVVEEAVTEEVVEEVAVEEPVKQEPTIGFVDGCDKLNVRIESNKDSGVAVILDKSTKIIIDLDNSTDDFYKIITSEGVEGYCMKKFITIK